MNILALACSLALVPMDSFAPPRSWSVMREKMMYGCKCSKHIHLYIDEIYGYARSGFYREYTICIGNAKRGGKLVVHNSEDYHMDEIGGYYADTSATLTIWNGNDKSDVTAKSGPWWREVYRVLSAVRDGRECAENIQAARHAEEVERERRNARARAVEESWGGK